MPFLLKVALRNIRRHRRRSLVTLATVASAVIGIVLFGGFIEANYTGLRESVIRSQYGHAQIHVAGYEAGHRADPDKVRLSPETAEAVRTLLEKDRHVLMSSRRIEFGALLGNEKTSQAVIVRGVEPGSIRNVIDLERNLSREQGGVGLLGILQAVQMGFGDDQHVNRRLRLNVVKSFKNCNCAVLRVNTR